MKNFSYFSQVNSVLKLISKGSVFVVVAVCLTAHAQNTPSVDTINKAHSKISAKKHAPSPSQTNGSSVISFNRDIRPILSDNCFACHGPDKSNRKANLSLNTFEEAIRDLGQSRYAIVPGNTDESELFKRITHADPSERMPPQSTEKVISSEQIEILRRWIKQGANYEKHWSYITPQKPAPPSTKDFGLLPEKWSMY